MKKVTTLMPVYNAMPFLPAAVQCLLDQSLANVEHIIIDGRSCDGSWQFLQGLRDPRIVTAQCAPGLGRRLSLGLELSQSEFVARMDADDLCSPHRFKKQLEFLLAHESVGAVGTQYAHFVTIRQDASTPRCQPSTRVSVSGFATTSRDCACKHDVQDRCTSTGRRIQVCRRG